MKVRYFLTEGSLGQEVECSRWEVNQAGALLFYRTKADELSTQTYVFLALSPGSWRSATLDDPNDPNRRGSK